MKKIILFVFALLVHIFSDSLAGVWRVGPAEQYKTPSEVMPLVTDFDTVLITAGEYPRDVGTWTKNCLRIKGVGGFAHMQSEGQSAQQKAIWVVQGDYTTIENIEFSGCSVPDKNGAGIRQEGANLYVQNCYFHDNENGILAGNNPESVIYIDNCEFARNGYGDGQSHNVYVNHIAELVFRYNFSHHARVGHCLKSRAARTVVLCNHFSDFADGNSSYLIDLPNGGSAIIEGNLLFQGPNAENRSLISYGREGVTEQTNYLHVVNNTMINKRAAGATFVSFAPTIEAPIFANNIFAGVGEIGNGSFQNRNNLIAQEIESIGFANPDAYDFHLTTSSPAINAGDELVFVDFPDLFPLLVEYQDTARSSQRVSDGKPDIGAFEFAGNTSIESEPAAEIGIICQGPAVELRFSEPPKASQAKAAFSDMLGNRHEAEVSIAANSVIIPCLGLPGGAYFLEIDGPGLHYKKKILLIK